MHMDTKEMQKNAREDSAVLKSRRLTGIITTHEPDPETLDMLQIAVESIEEGFTEEGTNVIVGEAQLRALHKDSTI